MGNCRDIIKRIFKALFPTIIVPAIVTALVFKLFGLTINALLMLIIFVQIYIIWAQLEVALRQTYLSVSEFEPEFKIEVEARTHNKIMAMDEGTIIGNNYDVKLKNVGKLLAENVYTIITTESKGISTTKLGFSGDLSPFETVDICTFKKRVSNDSKFTVKIVYDIIFGVHSEITFVKEPGIHEFVISKFLRIKSHSYTPLLNSFAELLSISQLLCSVWRFLRFLAPLFRLLSSSRTKRKQ